MKTTLLPLLVTLSGLVRSRAHLHLEILALRQQLAIITHRDGRRLRFRRGERFFWVWLYRLWPDCLHTPRIFSPNTLVGWHRKGFRVYWRWKSRHRPGGRPPVTLEVLVRDLIRRLFRENPLWGAPRVHGELRMLGIEVSQTAVAKYMLRHRGPPSQNWRTFLHNHAKDLESIDFFTVPTITFRFL